jgi:hypothetical protein
MEYLNFICDYVSVTPEYSQDKDLFSIEGQVQGAPLFRMVVDFQPQVVMDTKCIPEPNGISPKTQCIEPSEGYVIEANLEGKTLKLKGVKPNHLPAFGIYNLAEV